MAYKRLTDEEKEYIANNYLTKTDEEIASILGRNIETVRNNRKKLGVIKKPGGTVSTLHDLKENQVTMRALTESQRQNFFKTELQNSLFYGNLQSQFDKNELSFYLEEWGALCCQFEDIVATEKRQIDELIKAEIMGNRILRNIKIAEDEIRLIVDEVEQLRKTSDMENDEAAQERDERLNILIRSFHAQTQAMVNDYQKNVDMRNKILSELNARRRDRIDQIRKSNTTLIGVVKALQEREVREAHGKHIELIKKAKDRVKDEWRKPTRFLDGMVDCVLLDEHSEIEEETREEIKSEGDQNASNSTSITT